MFLNFTTIENSPEQLDEEELDFFFTPKQTRKYSFEETLFACECNHVYYNHELCEGKCYVNNCICQKLVYRQADLEIIFTIADRFEVENPNHSETDSPEWWIEFKEYIYGK